MRTFWYGERYLGVLVDQISLGRVYLSGADRAGRVGIWTKYRKSVVYARRRKSGRRATEGPGGRYGGQKWQIGAAGWNITRGELGISLLVGSCSERGRTPQGGG